MQPAAAQHVPFLQREVAEVRPRQSVGAQLENNASTIELCSLSKSAGGVAAVV